MTTEVNVFDITPKITPGKIVTQDKTRKKFICLLAVLFFLAGNAYASEYFRCGCDLMKIGDTKYQVIKQCGKPVSEDITGYTQKGYGMKIEELIYGPRGGVYYYLKFIGNRLVKIESLRH